MPKNLAPAFKVVTVIIHRSQHELIELGEDYSGGNTYSVNHSYKTFVNDFKEIQAHLTMNIQVNQKAGNGRYSSYKLNFCTLGVFEIENTESKLKISNFIKKNALSYVYPVAMQHAGDVAKKLNSSTPVMPFKTPEELLQPILKTDKFAILYTQT